MARLAPLPTPTTSHRIVKKLYNFVKLLLFFAIVAYGQPQKRIAIVNTEDDGEPPIKNSELTHLTDKLREIANKTLPPKSYAVMTQQSIVDHLGSQENMIKECKESEGCLAKLGRKINADYIGQARIGRFGEDLTIKVELYESGNGNLVNSFTGISKDIYSLLSVLDENAPALFKKLPGVSGGSFVAGGISGLEKAADYELYGEKRYVVNLNTDPSGAVLSFNGLPSASCAKTPCKAELREGNVRIIAALEQYETADTTVSITRNNQNITIRLKANFGVLEIRPAYLDGIGYDEQWGLTINGKAAYSWENRLSPGNYSVKLSHECYEAVGFTAGINKDKREVFDMSGNITLKKGGLDLSAERDGEPASEPVFVNGKRVGETPFSGSVPLCARVEIGDSREIVNVKLKHNEKVEYTHRYESPKFAKPTQVEYEYPKPMLEEEKQRESIKRNNGVLGAWIFPLGGGVSLNMNNIAPNYFKSIGRQFNPLNIEFTEPAIESFRLGMSLDLGIILADEDAIREKYGLADTVHFEAMHIKGHIFARYYPMKHLFLSGGAGWGYYRLASKETDLEMKISTPVFPVGAGIFTGSYTDNREAVGLVIEALCNFVPFTGHIAPYISINIGLKGIK